MLDQLIVWAENFRNILNLEMKKKEKPDSCRSRFLFLQFNDQRLVKEDKVLFDKKLAQVG